MPSFADDIVLAILALLLFGPKKLPVLARELGKWVAEFRRASNEFKYQMEEELRQSEQAEKQKQLAALEASSPAAPALEAPAETIPEHSIRGDATAPDAATEAAEAEVPSPESSVASEPIAIASSGDVSMMPPETGLPTPRGRSAHREESETKEETAHAD